MSMSTILLTGGTGYIGSHTCVELISARYDTILFDNLSNSSPAVVSRIEQITGKRPVFVKGDVRDRSSIDRVFNDYPIDAVLHFAGLKAVGESVTQSLRYYANNVGGSITLLDCMQSHGVRRLVFSSSATVYGMASEVPIKESAPANPVNPYGHAKRMVEQIMLDLARGDPRWRITSLRYFNPVGAHESGKIGEDPNGTPNNLMPFVTQVAVGRQPVLKVYGNDYPTTDGTGVRDYIHVSDLATAHVAALRRLMEDRPVEQAILNVGTGSGYSVMQLVDTFMRVTGRSVPCEVVARRPGDVASSYADTTLARRYLNWKATRDLGAMCRDAWRWQSENPDGYSNEGQSS